MTVLVRIFRFLFWLLVISWGVRLLRRLVAWILYGAASAPQQTVDAAPAEQTQALPRRLVRDPVCGMHVDETRAIPFREGGELLHFCSIACRDAYALSVKKLAANG
jgi:YHS domain-containing protein